MILLGAVQQHSGHCHALDSLASKRIAKRKLIQALDTSKD